MIPRDDTTAPKRPVMNEAALFDLRTARDPRAAGGAGRSIVALHDGRGRFTNRPHNCVWTHS
jgi:hypothetical protein